MVEANINPKETKGQNIQPAKSSVSNQISNLPKITSLLLPNEYELLPNTSELFELEFAFSEYKFLAKKEIIN